MGGVFEMFGNQFFEIGKRVLHRRGSCRTAAFAGGQRHHVQAQRVQGLAQIMHDVLDMVIARFGQFHRQIVLGLQFPKASVEIQPLPRGAQVFFERMLARAAQLIVAIRDGQTHHHGIKNHHNADAVVNGFLRNFHAQDVPHVHQPAGKHRAKPGQRVEANLAITGEIGHDPGQREGEHRRQRQHDQQLLEQLRGGEEQGQIEPQRHDDNGQQEPVQHTVAHWRLQEDARVDRTANDQCRAGKDGSIGIECRRVGPEVLKRRAVPMHHEEQRGDRIGRIGQEHDMLDQHEGQHGDCHQQQHHAVEQEVLGGAGCGVGVKTGGGVHREINLRSAPGPV